MAVEQNGDLGGRDAESVDGSVPRRPASAERGRSVLRTVGAGAAALTLAAGIMAGSVSDLPWNDFTEHPEFTAPVDTEPVVVGVVGASTSTGPKTVGQILDVVERAELAAVDSGRALDPEVQQAAAELGTLLSIYVAQRDAAVAPRVGVPQQREDVADAVPDEPADEPTAPDPAGEPAGDVPFGDPEDFGSDELRPPAEVDEPADDDGGSVRPEDLADAGDPEIEYGAAGDTGGPRSTADLEPIEPVDVPSLRLPTLDQLLQGDGALRVASPVLPDDGAAGGGSGSDEEDASAEPEMPSTAGGFGGAEEPDAEEPGAEETLGVEGDVEHEHVDDAVTFDDVVVAATRLSTLLDPAAAGYVVDIRPSVTELPDGTFVLSDGTPVTAGGLPLDAAANSLSQALRSVVDQHATSTAGYSNGRIPTSVLCAVPWAPGHMLRCDAALQLEALNEAYRGRFGTNIPITDSYRSYASQVAVRAAKPHLAAVPGTSNHGWGLALDLSTPISGGRSAEYAWLRVNGPDYGWDNPAWARLDGSKPEPWHFEFFAAGPIPDRATSTDDFATDGGSSTGGGSSDGNGSGGDSTGGSDGKKDSGDSKDGKKKDGDKKNKKDGKKDKKDKGKDKNKKGNGDKKDPKPKPKPKPTPTPTKPPADKPSPSPSPTPTPTEPTPSPVPTEPTEPPADEPSPEPTEPPADEPPADELCEEELAAEEQPADEKQLADEERSEQEPDCTEDDAPEPRPQSLLQSPLGRDDADSDDADAQGLRIS